MKVCEKSIFAIGARELPLLQGKTLEDVQGNKQGLDQLLLAMMAIFAKSDKPVWGVALSPIKVNSNTLE